MNSEFRVMIIKQYAIQIPGPFQAESKPPFKTNCRARLRYFHVLIKGWRHTSKSSAEFKRSELVIPSLLPGPGRVQLSLETNRSWPDGARQLRSFKR